MTGEPRPPAPGTSAELGETTRSMGSWLTLFDVDVTVEGGAARERQTRVEKWSPSLRRTRKATGM